MAEPRCTLTELPVTGCAHYRGIPDTESAGEPGPWITARYEGHCQGCDDDIYGGDRIRSDGHGGWLCQDCGAQPAGNIRELLP
jgi:hypothetical protein